MKPFLQYIIALTVSFSAAWASASKMSTVDELVEFFLGRHPVKENLIDAFKLNHLGSNTIASKLQMQIERSLGALGSDSYLIRMGSNKATMIVDFVTVSELNDEVLSLTFYAKDLVSIYKWIDDINGQLAKKKIPVQILKTGQSESLNVSIQSIKGNFRATFKGLTVDIPVSDTHFLSADELKSLLNTIGQTKSPNAIDIEIF